MNAQQFSTSIPQIDSPANIKVTLSYLDTSHISQDNLAPSVNEPALPCTHDIPTPDTLTKQVHKDHNAVSCFACSKSFNDNSMDIGMSFLFLLFFFLSNFLFFYLQINLSLLLRRLMLLLHLCLSLSLILFTMLATLFPTPLFLISSMKMPTLLRLPTGTLFVVKSLTAVRVFESI